MTGIFPNGGVPCGQTFNAECEVPLEAGCEALYHAARCNPAFDPMAANAVISEIVNVIKCSGLTYDCQQLDNLCEAIRKMSSDAIYACLSGTFPTVDNACGIEQLVLATDANGCKRIATYSEAAATISSVRDNSVWGQQYPLTAHPIDPNNTNSYYMYQDLYNDILNGTVNNQKLSQMWLTTQHIFLQCGTVVEFEILANPVLNPKYNNGEGANARIAIRIDGVFPTGSGAISTVSGTMTNFLGTYIERIRYYLPAGTHQIDTFGIGASGNIMAQLYVSGHPTLGSNATRILRTS